MLLVLPESLSTGLINRCTRRKQWTPALLIGALPQALPYEAASAYDGSNPVTQLETEQSKFASGRIRRINRGVNMLFYWKSREHFF